MSMELHEGVVAFRPVSSGREAIMLGTVTVGEISPTVQPNSRFPTCFRLALPEASSVMWQPAYDVADAKRQVIRMINDWMIAAGVTPLTACQRPEGERS